jgi:hypothetical protein
VNPKSSSFRESHRCLRLRTGLPKDSTGWQKIRLADVYTFNNGKAIQMRAFQDRKQALQWVGLSGKR